MKFALASLAALVLGGSLAAPAIAAERHGFADSRTAVLIDVQYRDDDYDRDDRDWDGPRRDWREHRERRGDWDGRRERRWERERNDRLSERQVARRVIRAGFVRIEDIDRRRGRYVVRAVRANGALVRLAIDAYDGTILSRERIGWLSRGDYRRDHRGPDGVVEFDLGDGTIGLYSR